MEPQHRRFLRDVFRKYAPHECSSIPYHLGKWKNEPKVFFNKIIKKYKVKNHEIPDEIANWLGISKKRKASCPIIPKPSPRTIKSTRPRIHKSDPAHSSLRTKVAIPEPDSKKKKKSKQNEKSHHVQKIPSPRFKRPAYGAPKLASSMMPKRVQTEEGNYDRVMNRFSKQRLKPKKPPSKNVKNVRRLNERIRSTPIRAEVARERIFVREPGAAFDYGEPPEFGTTPYGDNDEEPEIPQSHKSAELFDVGESYVQEERRLHYYGESGFSQPGYGEPKPIPVARAHRPKPNPVARPHRPKAFRPKPFQPKAFGFQTGGYDAEQIMEEARQQRNTMMRESARKRY